MTSSDLQVLWLGDDDACLPERVGAKTAHLSRMAARWPVPPGFCLPADCHRGLEGESRRGAARAVRDLVGPAYRRLADEAGRRRPAVAVRSSAVGEDSADASFAGQHDTFLNIVGRRAIVDAVLECWESADSDTARSYRAARGMTDVPAMAVLVQQLVPADVSAVVFSADPVNGDRDSILINASWGLGEAVVDGAVTPDTYVVDREGLEVTSRQIADKDVEVVPTRRGTRQVDVDGERRSRPSLTTDQAVELAHLAVDAEEQMGWPVDLECAFHDGRLFLLQCRPITTLPTS